MSEGGGAQAPEGKGGIGRPPAPPGEALAGPGDADEIVQRLPPLQGVPGADPRRLAAFYEAEVAGLAGVQPEALPGWEAASGLPDEAGALERILAWTREATARTGRPVLDLGAGAGLLLKELGLGGLRAVGLELVPGPCARARDTAVWAAGEADRLAEDEARRAADKPLVWWAGDGAPPAPKLAPRKHRPAAIVRGDAATPPFRDESFGCVIAAGIVHHIGEWQAALEAWMRLLVPGGTLIVATPAEKDQDEPSFLSVLGRSLMPGIVTGYPRSQDLTWVLSLAGFDVDAVSVLRIRRSFEDMDERDARPAGTPSEAWRTLLEDASESLRALYEIDEEGMSWRYLTVKARKPSP